MPRKSWDTCTGPSNQQHDAHHSQTVRVLYQWHPLFGEELPVTGRKRDRAGDHVLCRLPDDTICVLPTWMFDPTPTHSLGPPLIAVEALQALRDLLDALRAGTDGDQASSIRSSTEGVHEGSCIPIATDVATESADECDLTHPAGRDASRVGARAGRSVGRGRAAIPRSTQRRRRR